MGEWLDMPKRLRTPHVRAMVSAWLRANPEAFAAAYEAQKKGGNLTKYDRSLIERARAGDTSASGDLWDEFINGAVYDQRVTITNPEAQMRLKEARAILSADEGNERIVKCRELLTYFEGRVQEYAGLYLYRGQGTSQPTPPTPVRQPVRAEINETLLALANEAPSGAFEIREQVNFGVTVEEDELNDDDTQEVAKIVARMQGVSREQWEGFTQGKWDKLARSIQGSAERVWRDLFLDSTTQPHGETLADVAYIAQQLMLLWLETVLYQDRAEQNAVAQDVGRGRQSSDKTTRAGIRKHVETYHKLIDLWQDDVRRGAKEIIRESDEVEEVTFRSHQFEAQQLRRLIGEFSPKNAQELGWASQAADAQDELRYQFRDELRREYWADGQRFKSLGMLLLKFASGYGTRPLFFVRTVGILFLLDAGLFFLSDFFNPGITSSQHFCATSAPHIQQWTDVWDEIVRYAYIAVTHLTSLGLNSALSSYCGGAFAELVVIFSTVCGFFMLGLLSAMLYTQLSQSD